MEFAFGKSAQVDSSKLMWTMNFQDVSELPTDVTTFLLSFSSFSLTRTEFLPHTYTCLHKHTRTHTHRQGTNECNWITINRQLNRIGHKKCKNKVYLIVARVRNSKWTIERNALRHGMAVSRQCVCACKWKWIERKKAKDIKSNASYGKADNSKIKK